MADREREARIREGDVLDREEFKTTLNDFCRECHGFSSPMPDYDVRGTLEAHDATQRAEIERLERIEQAALDALEHLNESVVQRALVRDEVAYHVGTATAALRHALNDGGDDG